MTELQVIHYDDVPVEEFLGGAHYRKLIGEEIEGAPVVTGIQISPPRLCHASPFASLYRDCHRAGRRGGRLVESVRRDSSFGPGGTVVCSPPTNATASGWWVETPLKTYGVHGSPSRIGEIHDD